MNIKKTTWNDGIYNIFKQKLASIKQFLLQYYQFLQNWYSSGLCWWQIPKTHRKQLPQSVSALRLFCSVSYMLELIVATNCSWICMGQKKTYRTSSNTQKFNRSPGFSWEMSPVFKAMKKKKEYMLYHSTEIKYI